MLNECWAGTPTETRRLVAHTNFTPKQLFDLGCVCGGGGEQIIIIPKIKPTKGTRTQHIKTVLISVADTGQQF